MNLFQPVWAIALNTFRETRRDRVLYAFVIFAVILTLAATLLGSLSIHQNVRVLEDIGLFTISTIGGVIAIFVGTNLVYKELDKRTIYLLLTKPIARWQFILGKFLGLSVCIFIVTLLMGVFLIGLALFNQEHVSALGSMFGALGLVYLELLLIIALACFFSTFATPLMSVLFTLALWLAGHLGQSLLMLGNMSQSHTVKTLFRGIYYALPDLSRLTQMRFAIMSNGIDYSADTILVITSYLIAYIVILLSLATVITERREFN